ncbi:uncharacterized protein LOC131930317 [Physella acuta]|uniref:uncharacterized protein LOC131930317 n=1 Tax=Physella acuta TaxID=109671 RepID=UPI0027DABD86|nr:uncharacterized protein LOC131930317 [Physella acuta]
MRDSSMRKGSKGKKEQARKQINNSQNNSVYQIRTNHHRNIHSGKDEEKALNKPNIIWIVPDNKSSPPRAKVGPEVDACRHRSSDISLVKTLSDQSSNENEQKTNNAMLRQRGRRRYDVANDYPSEFEPRCPNVSARALRSLLNDQQYDGEGLTKQFSKRSDRKHKRSVPWDIPPNGDDSNTSIEQFETNNRSNYLFPPEKKPTNTSLPHKSRFSAGRDKILPEDCSLEDEGFEDLDTWRLSADSINGRGSRKRLRDNIPSIATMASSDDCNTIPSSYSHIKSQENFQSRRLARSSMQPSDICGRYKKSYSSCYCPNPQCRLSDNVTCACCSKTDTIKKNSTLYVCEKTPSCDSLTSVYKGRKALPGENMQMVYTVSPTPAESPGGSIIDRNFCERPKTCCKSKTCCCPYGKKSTCDPCESPQIGTYICRPHKVKDINVTQTASDLALRCGRALTCTKSLLCRQNGCGFVSFNCFNNFAPRLLHFLLSTIRYLFIIFVYIFVLWLLKLYTSVNHFSHLTLMFTDILLLFILIFKPDCLLIYFLGSN